MFSVGDGAKELLQTVFDANMSFDLEVSGPEMHSTIVSRRVNKAETSMILQLDVVNFNLNNEMLTMKVRLSHHPSELSDI